MLDALMFKLPLQILDKPSGRIRSRPIGRSVFQMTLLHQPSTKDALDHARQATAIRGRDPFQGFADFGSEADSEGGRFRHDNNP